MNNNFERRDVLKGLLALPGAAAMNGLMPAEAQKLVKATKPVKTAAAAATKSTMNFNVVLHGTFALEFDIKRGKASVVIPRVLNGSRDAHIYIAGSFRQEAPLDASKEVIDFNLPLDQGNPLPAILSTNPEQFAIVRNSQLARDDQGPVRNILQFPFPHGLEVGLAQVFRDPPNHKFFNNTTFANQPAQMPLTLVLRYSLASGGVQVPPFNFHIYAQSDEKNGHHSVTAAFAALASLYKDVGKLELTQDVIGDVSSKTLLAFNSNINLPADLLDDEVLSLEDRDQSFGGVHVGTCAGLILING